MLLNKVSYLGVLLLPFLFMTCSKDETSGPAKLMFVNGLTDGNPSTVIIGDSTILALTAGFGLFTQYNQINGGNQTVKLKDKIDTMILATKSINFSEGKNYTLMAAGTSGTAELLVKEDDLSISDSTKAYVRLINLSANSLPMTMYITGGADLATNVSYKSVSDFANIQPAKYELSIKSGSTLFTTILNFNLLAKKKYSVLITGLINQTPKATYNIIVNKT